MELYAERGYEQTTVAEIAQRAGLTARTFFRYFADKREVLFAGSEALGEQLEAALTAAPASATPSQATPAPDGEDDAWDYETDLVALAATTSPAGTGTDPGSAPDAASPAGLEAELAAFTALLAEHRDGDHTTDGDTAGERPQAAS